MIRAAALWFPLLSWETVLQDKGLVRMAGDGAGMADHVGHAVPANIDAGDDVAEGVVFINAYHVQGGCPAVLHRHSHGDAQAVPGDGGGVNGQIVRLLEEGQEAAVQALRRAGGSLDDAAVLAVESNVIQLVNFGGFLQHFVPACPECHGVRFPCRAHTGVSRDGHHPVRQHVYVGFHGFC